MAFLSTEAERVRNQFSLGHLERIKIPCALIASERIEEAHRIHILGNDMIIEMASMCPDRVDVQRVLHQCRTISGDLLELLKRAGSAEDEQSHTAIPAGEVPRNAVQDSLFLRLRGDVHLQIGITLASMGDDAGAERAFTRAVQILSAGAEAASPEVLRDQAMDLLSSAETLLSGASGETSLGSRAQDWPR